MFGTRTTDKGRMVDQTVLAMRIRERQGQQ